MTNETITYTTAPVDYDWFGTHTLEECVGTASNSKPIRKVAGPSDRVESQRGRYGSGCHMAVDEVEWNKLVNYKLVKLP